MITQVTRELLELAAKSIGLRGRVASRMGGEDLIYELSADSAPWPKGTFNPVDDDGDALRLAVKLGLKVDIYRKHSTWLNPCVEVFGYESRRSLAVEHAADNDALQAATRLAITRAAAEIGRAMS